MSRHQGAQVGIPGVVIGDRHQALGNAANEKTTKAKVKAKTKANTQTKTKER